MEIDNLSLQPVTVNTNPGPEYGSQARRWQGIPGIERTPMGRLWTVWYSGGDTEGPENFVVMVTSEDDGETWSEQRLVIDPPGQVRAFDPVLWHDPLGRLWLFWAQSLGLFDGRVGVWAIRTTDSESDHPVWSAPRRLCHGIMMNKPTVLSTGEWLLPAAVWAVREPYRPEVSTERYSNAYCSTDQGETWLRRGGADVPDRNFDEHMIVEQQDGTLWMLVRTEYGIGQSRSHDRGYTWAPGQPTDLGGPTSRFHIRRLRSGRLLLINHFQFTGRSHLTAFLSEDDGATWPFRLLLDERRDVSYPDSVEAEDGRIFAIYDRSRRGEMEILLAVFTEEDVIQGRCVSPQARLRQLVSKIGARG